MTTTLSVRRPIGQVNSDGKVFPSLEFIRALEISQVGVQSGAPINTVSVMALTGALEARTIPTVSVSANADMRIPAVAPPVSEAKGIPTV